MLGCDAMLCSDLVADGSAVLEGICGVLFVQPYVQLPVRFRDRFRLTISLISVLVVLSHSRLVCLGFLSRCD